MSNQLPVPDPVQSQIERVRRHLSEAPDAMNFLARGMLISVLLGLRLPDHLGDDAVGDELMNEAFGDMIAVFRDGTKAG